MATFGKSRRFDINSAQTPAPGAYDPKCLDKAPAAAVLGKRQEKNKENAPPVGHYEVVNLPEAKFPRPTSSASSRSRNHLSILKKSLRLSRSTSSLNDAASVAASSFTGSFVSRDEDIKASAAAGSLTRDEDNSARASPRLEELERDLGVTLQLNDQSEERIASLEAENRRLRDEKAELEARVDSETEKAEKLSDEMAEMRQSREVDFRTLSEDSARKEREIQAELESCNHTLAVQSARLAEKDESIASLNERLAENELAFNEQLAEKNDKMVEKDETIVSLNERLKDVDGQLCSKDDEYYRLFEQRTASLEALQKEKSLVKEMKAEKEKLEVEHRVATKLAEDRQAELLSELQSLRETQRHLAEDVVGKGEEISKLKEALNLSEEKADELTGQVAVVEAKGEAAKEALLQQLNHKMEINAAKAEERMAQVSKEKSDEVEAIQLHMENEKRRSMEVREMLMRQLAETRTASEEKCRRMDEEAERIAVKARADAETRERCFEEEKSAMKLGFDQKSILMKTEMEAEVQAIKRLSEEKCRRMEEEAETRERCFEEERSVMKLGFDQKSISMKTEIEAEVQTIKRLSEEKCRRMEEEAETIAVKGRADAETRERCFKEERSAMKLGFDQKSILMKTEMEAEVQAIKQLSEEKCRRMEVEAETSQRCFKEERSAIKLGFDQESGKMKTEMEAEVQAMRRLSEEKTESQRRLHEEEKSLLVYQQREEVFLLSSQFDTERTALMRELDQTQMAAAQREANLRRNVEEKESERSDLAERLQRKRNQMEGLLKSQQSFQDLMPKVELAEKLLKEKNELEQEMFRRRLEAAQLENTRDAEKREAAENLSGAKQEVSKLQQQMSKLQQQMSMAEAETKKALEKEDKMRRALAQRKEDEEAMEALRNDASIWESKCQQLTELIGPFKSQLEQYGAERETLMEQKNTTQKELGRLQDDIAKHMGHQNHKQKIHHLVTLKEEKFKLMQKNQELQMELAKTQAAHAKCGKRH